MGPRSTYIFSDIYICIYTRKEFECCLTSQNQRPGISLLFTYNIARFHNVPLKVVRLALRVTGRRGQLGGLMCVLNNGMTICDVVTHGMTICDVVTHGMTICDIALMAHMNIPHDYIT